MSKTRDTIDEIEEIKKRRLFDSSMSELSIRLRELEYSFNHRDKSDLELIRYYPVALVACMEGYFRMVIRDLIDSEGKYLSNIEKEISPLKLDFSSIKAIHGKTVTIGELFAHQISISQLNHIERMMSKLIDGDFLQKVAEASDRWDHEVCNKPKKPILENPKHVFKQVVRTFELRHIICHEIATAHEITASEVEICFENCVSFLRASLECISEILSPNSPLTQADMNSAALDDLSSSEEKLKEIINQIKSNATAKDAEKISVMYKKWEDFSEAWLSFRVGERDESGSIWPVMYSSYKKSLITGLTTDLENYRDRKEGEF